MAPMSQSRLYLQQDNGSYVTRDVKWQIICWNKFIAPYLCTETMRKVSVCAMKTRATKTRAMVSVAVTKAMATSIREVGNA